MIDKDKAEEYQQVAALLAMGIDNLLDISQAGLTAERLTKQIEFLHKTKEEIINCPDERRRRYNACCMLFGGVIAGLIKKE